MTAFWLIVVYLAALYLQVGVKFPVLAPLRPLMTLAILVAVTGLLYMARRGGGVTFEGQIRLLVVFLGFLGASLLFAHIRIFALDKWLDFAKIVVMAFFMVNVIDSLRKTSWLIYAFLIIHVPVAIEGIRGFYTPTGMREEAESLRGTLSSFLGNSNDFALAVLIVLPYAYFLMPIAKSSLRRLFLGGCCILLGLAAMFTFSRGGFVTLLALLGYFALQSARRLQIAALAGVLAFVSLAILPAAYWQRMGTITEYDSDWNATTRFWAWRAGLNMALENPILGMGPGNFVTGYRKFYRPEEATSRQAFTAHSIYFQVMGELGFVGLGLFGWFVASTWRAQSALLKELQARGLDESDDGRFAKAAGQAMQASLLAFLTGGAFLSAAYYPHLWLNGALTQLLVSGARQDLFARSSLAPRETEVSSQRQPARIR